MFSCSTACTQHPVLDPPQEEESKTVDITEYISASGEILYPKLLKDEVSPRLLSYKFTLFLLCFSSWLVSGPGA